MGGRGVLKVKQNLKFFSTFFIFFLLFFHGQRLGQSKKQEDKKSMYFQTNKHANIPIG